LPKVFEQGRRPWIDPDVAEPDQIQEVVLCCPTGALEFERLDGSSDESPPDEGLVRIAADGPLYLHGDIEIVDGEGTVLERGVRRALCRCGASATKPFCDNTHETIGFSDAGHVTGTPPSSDASGSKMTVTLAKNGPLLVGGAVVLEDANGDVQFRGVKAAFCRCGASKTKPFCDGSHVGEGFESDP